MQPLVAGIYTADPEQLSMAATMPQFLEYERQHGSLLRATLRMPWSSTNRSLRTGHFSDQLTPDQSPATSSPNTNPEHDPTHDASGARYSLFAAPRNGMTSLVNALAARLPPGTIHLNTPVTSITRESDNRWKLDFLPDFGFRIRDCRKQSRNPESGIAQTLRRPHHRHPRPRRRQTARHLRSRTRGRAGRHPLRRLRSGQLRFRARKSATS